MRGASDYDTNRNSDQKVGNESLDHGADYSRVCKNICSSCVMSSYMGKRPPRLILYRCDDYALRVISNRQAENALPLDTLPTNVYHESF